MARTDKKYFETKNGLKCVIRNPEKEDAEKLIEFAKTMMAESVFLRSGPEEFNNTIQQEEEWITKMNEAPADIGFIAEIDGKITGFINFNAKKKQRIAHVGGLGMSVRKIHWGNGIGTELLGALIDWAKRNPQIRKVTLEVLADNERGLALYKKMGFEVEGRRIAEVQRERGKFFDEFLMYLMVKENN